MSSAAITARLQGVASPVDLGWRNLVFSARTAAAAILALAIAYWLELKDPQWATLTVYLLALPTVGGALAKGAWRAVGTLVGGTVGLGLVALFSQAAELLVVATTLLVAASFYASARLRNYAAYGALLAGYSMLLVAYEGSSDPLNAWTIAADRTAEILIGIACGVLASLLIWPRYAGDALREALSHTFSGLAHYVAAALRLSTALAAFADLRRRMVADVVSFDALRSSAAFEAPEMRADEQALKRTVREFLMVLAIARGLFFRLDAFAGDGAQDVLDRIRPTLEAVAARVDRVAADPAARNDPRRLRREMAAARASLSEATAGLEAMAGAAPFDALANGLLVLRRAGYVLRALSLAVLAGAASIQRTDSRAGRPGRERDAAEGRPEAALNALRAGLSIALLSALWLATGWSQGFTALSGGAIMLFFAVNQDNPEAIARSFFVWSAAGIAVAYLAMVFVLPFLEGFEALAAMLMLALLPAGLMAGTPSHAVAGIALGGFTVSQIGVGNVFAPNEMAFVNASAALLIGMAVCLAVLAVMPVTSLARRGQSRAAALGEILPAVARREIVPRRAYDEIVATLAALLPRLALDRPSEDDFLRGALGAASSAIELGRLAEAARAPDMPEQAAQSLEDFLQRFAAALERLAASRDPAESVAQAEGLVAQARADLAALPLQPGGAEARAVLGAGASLRFLADRFIIDRAYFAHSDMENGT
ncbi:FUSC family protein [Rhodoblastus sp.]|uniref:FUSC family protein n=1 Tax=Rhodoblastus sp. TaxID=1962975 RepID=UPI0035AE2969